MYVARAMRHHAEVSEAFATLEEALSFLRYGEEEGLHAGLDVTHPDGTVQRFDPIDCVLLPA